MLARTTKPRANRPVPNERPHDDSWVDRIADEVQALLAEHGLDLELVVFFDNVAEVLHATGFDGSPARYFRSLEGDVRPTPEPLSVKTTSSTG